MNKRDYTTEEHRVSQRIFFPHHTKDENSVYSVVNPVVDSILCANKAIACYIPVSKRAASCLVTET